MKRSTVLTITLLIIVGLPLSLADLYITHRPSNSPESLAVEGRPLAVLADRWNTCPLRRSAFEWAASVFNPAVGAVKRQIAATQPSRFSPCAKCRSVGFPAAAAHGRGRLESTGTRQPHVQVSPVNIARSPSGLARRQDGGTGPEP